jgi:hypothetical protein
MDKFSTIQISYKIIEEFLRFPKDVHIESIPSSNESEVTFHLVGDGIPEELSGKEVRLMVTRTYDRAGNFILETELTSV